MAEIQAQRTLVKSPPELWAELSDRESLAEHLGEFGEIRITRTQPESTVAWEGERICGTVSIEASGWGTQVSLTARIDAPEAETPPPAAPPERVEHALEVVGTDVVRIEPPPPVEPAFDTDRAATVLGDVLDRLGAAHHRPFSRS